jgi:Ca2+-binding RTX toxin-like protein
VNGGDGNDTVIGSEFSDTTNGGNGNDRLVAAKGALDAMNGDAGDDTLVWNNGEGTDNMNGGDGTDTIENNGSDAGATANEVYTAETIPGGYKFSRTSAGAFDLFVSNSEKYVNNMFGGDDSFSQNNAVGGIAITLNAGAGNDNLGGTDGNDVVNGEAGNDTLNPGKGNDAMNGGEGDDLMVWNPGEGSDGMEGGPGNDTAQDNGGAVPEHFIVSPNGARVTATRDTQAPFFLDIGTTETLDLNTLGGDDSVDVNKGLGALIKVDADLGDGNDSIKARNGAADVINGGNGTDSARIDKTDAVTAVEKISGLDRKAPKIKLAAKRLKLKNGAVKFKVSCPKGETSCTGSVKIFNAKKKLVGSKKVTLKGNKSKTLTIKLKKAAVAKIKAQGKVKYTVKFRAKDASNNVATLTKKFTLRA